MEEKAKFFKSILKIVGFSVVGCSVIATLIASSNNNKKKNNILLLPNQIHKEKIVEVEEKIVVNPSKSIKHMDVDWAMKIDFPEEVIVDILSRLPVRSLLRFKCASKFWKSIISEPFFKMKQWNHAKNNQKFQKFLIGLYCQSSFDSWVGTISFYCSSASSVQRVEDVQKLGYPSNDKDYPILCCCDGLFLCGSRDNYMLWNPSTNESVVLPDPEFLSPSQAACGLGYDSTNDDYKILMIDRRGHGSSLPNKILALKSGSWRKIDNHPRGFSNCVPDHSLAFVHGAFHWISMDILHKNFVVSFNISNEAYGEIPLPKGICNISNMNYFNTVYLIHGVSGLGGMLCAYYTYRNMEAGTFMLWVMKDYGVKESWSLLFTIRDSQLYSVIPRYRFADGEVLLYYNGAEYSGLRTSKGPYGVLPASLVSNQVFCYTESLIFPKLLT